MSINSYARIECSFPIGTEVHEDKYTPVIKEHDGRMWVEDEFSYQYSDRVLDDLVKLFGKPLDKVPGLDLYLWYECWEEGYWKCELKIEDGECDYWESEIVMRERPMSECPIDIGTGTND